MIRLVTAVKLREWRGVKPVAGPAGVAITTRLWTTPEDERVLDMVAQHLGGLRRADLAAVSRPEPLDQTLGGAATRQERRDRLNARKKALTAELSARWANAIIAGNDAQYRLARDAQHRHITGLWAAINTIEKRLAQPTADTLSPEQRKARKNAKLLKGYATQAERFAKQRRLQRLRVEPGRVQADRDNHRVHVVEGGKRLAKTRHNLDNATLTLPEWRDKSHGTRRGDGKGVTRTRPEDRVVRATDQAAPDDRQVSTRNRHRPGTGEPNPARPAGQERGTWAGQPLPRHRPTTAVLISSGWQQSRSE